MSRVNSRQDYLHSLTCLRLTGTDTDIELFTSVGSKHGSNGNHDGNDGFSTLRIENKTRKKLYSSLLGMSLD